MRNRIIAALWAAVVAISACSQAFAAATLLPNGEQCFLATAATSGGTYGPLVTLGSISGGSSYVSGTYTAVPLTGGSGFGAQATITVTGGVVTAVSVTNVGSHYAGGDTLSASNTNLGGTGSGFSVPVVSVSTTGTGFVGLLGTITGGTGGTSGTYGGVSLTGGSGSGVTANVTVSGGAVTAVAILNPGLGYQVGDVLSANSGAIGGVSGFSVPVSSVTINNALAGGRVFFYVPGTNTFKSTWFNSDQAAIHQNTNPVGLDQNGCAIIYGTGSYREVLQDSLGNTIWDQVTTDTSANNSYFWAGTAGGTPNAITVTDAGFNATDGTQIAFTAIATNTSSVTLLPSGYLGSPIAVEKDTTAGPVALTGGEITQNNPIQVVYRALDSAFHILNPVIQSNAGSTTPLCGAIGYSAIDNNSNTQIAVTAASLLTVSPLGTFINRSNLSATLNFLANGANGLDTGALAGSTFYYIWLIDNGAAPATLASLSATSPTMPTGYTFKCRVGAWVTNGAAQLLNGAEFGDTMQLSNISTSTTNFSYNTITGTCFSSFTAVAFTNAIPPTAQFAIGGLSVVNGNSLGISPVASGGGVIMGFNGAVAGSQAYMPFKAPMTTPQTLNICNSATANALFVNGWVDSVNAH